MAVPLPTTQIIQDTYQRQRIIKFVSLLGAASTQFRIAGMTLQGGNRSTSNNKYGNCIASFTVNFAELSGGSQPL